MRITHLEKLTQEKWVNLFAARYEHNGHAGRWVFASRHEEPHTGRVNDAVIIVPLLRNPGEPVRLVLIKEFRVPVGDYVVGLPAGLIDPGEAAEDAIRREMHEETGFELVKIRHVTQPLYSSSGLTDEAAAMAFVDVRGHAESRQALEVSEEIEVVLADYEGVCRLCSDDGLYVDAKAWTVLFMYQQLGRLE